MQLYNKGKRTITIKSGQVKPEQLFTVSDEEGKKLLNLFKGEVIKASENKEEVNELEVKLAVAEDKIKKLEKSNKEVSKLKKELKDAEIKINELTDKLVESENKVNELTAKLIEPKNEQQTETK